MVHNDWTERWQYGFLRLSRVSQIQPRQRVTVCEQLEGRLCLFDRNCELTYGITRTEPRCPRKRVAHAGPTKSIQGQKPATIHPWRGEGACHPHPGMFEANTKPKGTLLIVSK